MKIRQKDWEPDSITIGFKLLRIFEFQQQIRGSWTNLEISKKNTRLEIIKYPQGTFSKEF